MPSHGRPCVPVSLSPPLRRTPVHWVGVHAYGLVLPQSPLKGPISTHSHILRSSGSGLQHVNLGRDTVQVTTLCPQTSSTTGFYKVRFFFFLTNLHTMRETCVQSSKVRKITWKRKWQPTPVFVPEEFHRQRRLTGYCPWGGKESDTTE